MASSADVIESLGIQITSNASGATKSLNTLNKGLERLIGNLTSVQSKSAGTVIGNVGTQAQKTSTATNNATKSFNLFGNSTKSAKTNVKSLASTFGSLYANFFWVIRAVKQLGKAVESSMDYVETYNYFNVTMDKIGAEWSKDYKQWGYDTAEAYADSFQQRIQALNKKMTGYELGEQGEATYTGAKNLGLDVETMMNYQASIGAVTNSLGLMGETSVNTQKAMSMLAADLSSFKNIDLSSVMTNLQSGLIGQSRALYKYGIDITNARLETLAYELGISKTVTEMSQAEKMQLRVIAILRDSRVAWGDQANTLNSVANQYRILKQQFSNLTRTIGNLFLPVVEMVLPVVNGLVIAMNELLQAFGVSLWGDNWLKNIMTGTSAGYTGDDVLGDLADDSEDLSEGLDKANESAKKLKNNLIGIDKLNIISPDTNTDSDSDDGSDSEIDLSNQIASAVADYEKVWEEAFKRSENLAQKYANNIVSAFKTGDWKSVGAYFSSKINQALKDIDWNKAYSNAKGFGSGLANFLNGLITPELFSEFGKTIASALNSKLKLDYEFFKNLDWEQIGSALVTGITSFFKTWDAKLTAETFSEFAKGLMKALKSAIKTLSDEGAFETLGQKIVDFICEIDWGGLIWNFGNLWLAFVDALGKLPADFGEGVVESLYKNIFGKDVETPEGLDKTMEILARHAFTNVTGFGFVGMFINASEIQKELDKIGNNISDWYNDDVKPWFTKEKWQKVFSVIEKELNKVWEDVSTWWNETGVPDWFNNNVKPWFTKEKWQETYKNIKDGLKTKWQEFETWWNSSGVKQWYEEKVKPLFSKENWNFKGIKDGLEQAFNNAILGLKTIWNRFAEWLNEKLEFKWDDIKIAGKTIVKGGEIDLGKLPTFDIKGYKTGGFPEDGLFFANHTELVGKFANGKTAVVNNGQIVASVSQGVAQAVSSVLTNGNFGGNRNPKVEVPVIINGREVARAVNYENARSGVRNIGYNTGY